MSCFSILESSSGDPSFKAAAVWDGVEKVSRRVMRDGEGNICLRDVKLIKYEHCSWVSHFVSFHDLAPIKRWDK